MSFIDLDIKDLYVTDTDDIPDEFYNEVLPEAVIYKRAAGFFSSSALVSVGKGLREFYYNGGRMKLLISPEFSEEDYIAIDNGYKAKKDLAIQKIVEAFDIDKFSKDDGCNLLAWLIYENRLDIQVVVRKDKKKIGIFHDKFSVLIDEDGNKVTFRGSMNESETGYVANYESIEVDFSWDKNGIKRVTQREIQFDEIWKNNGNKWETVEFPQAIIDKIIVLRRPIEIQPLIFQETHENSYYDAIPRIPADVQLRNYQNKAIANWIKNGSLGIFEMATGTGKTITSIAAMVKILEVYYKNAMRCGMVIVVPYKVLLEQWVNELDKVDIKPIKGKKSKLMWEKRAQDQIELFNAGVRNKLFLITTNKTFSEETFQKQIKSIKGDYIFCADEMHHLLSDGMQNCLPQSAKYRLGLSATLMTNYSINEMEELKKYFGGVVFTFTMKEAIDQGFLTKYYYYPVFVELTDEEKEEYYLLSDKISNIIAANNGNIPENNQGLTALFSQRSRLIASADNKIKKLLEYRKTYENTSFNIFYCGDRIEAATNEKFISKVTDLLSNKVGLNTSKFTAEENQHDREKILSLFKQGIINALSAIRCLDEGVDIPELQRAFILSSGTNPKEFIQRRGRILRKCKGKDFAYIYDFIVIPTLNKNEILMMSDEERKTEIKIITREYERLKEFADLAENRIEAYDMFLKTWQIYLE